MKIGLIGLGKMGYALSLNMKDSGVEVVAMNRSPEKVDEIIKEGVKGVYTLEALVDAISDERRVIWLMVPSGKPVDDMIESLIPLLKPNDIIIDGGNSNYKDTIRRHRELKSKGIDYVDVARAAVLMVRETARV